MSLNDDYADWAEQEIERLEARAAQATQAEKQVQAVRDEVDRQLFILGEPDEWNVDIHRALRGVLRALDGERDE